MRKMIGLIRRLFCSHNYTLVSWGDRFDMPRRDPLGSYMEVVCTKCQKHKRKEFTHTMSDTGLVRYCKANRWDYPGNKK